MKTTLFTLLLFLSVNLMGQTDSTSESKLDTTLMVIYDDYYNDDIYVELNFKDYINTKIDKRIIELWKEYQVECWNDSTLGKFYVDPNTTTEIAPGFYSTTLMMGYYIDKWYHKEPTLIDFMQFIERKTTDK
jgi:hypothetical protein